MKNQFIPYKQALELKELGVDEACFGYYDIDGEFSPYNAKDWVWKTTIEDYKFSCKALTWKQAFDWFREKHNLLYSINGIHSTEPFELDCQILNISNGSTWQLSYSGNDYEEAELECLKKLIEIVKEKLS